MLYYLYGVERTGRMTARRFIGKHDWYREGADMLVRNQDHLSSFWRGTGNAENNPLIGTSFALLFMSKGRRPVLVAKLKHGPDDDWNQHRSDLANLTSYVEKKWKRDLTWQVIDPAAATVEDLLQAPVLFISGRQAPQFTAEQKAKLRDYVDRGGFIFAEGCCGGGEFEQGFRKLMSEVFPEQEYKLRLLPPEHPIWRAEEPVDPNYLRPLWGIDIGCRTSVVFCPEDLSCYWELARPGRRQPLPEAVQAEVAAVSAIGANVMAYATNRELKYKFEHFTTAAADRQQDNFDRGKLYVAKLLHPGGCNAAPGALANLLRVAGEKLELRVSTEPRELGLSDPKLFQYHLVFMHGRHNFRLTPQERKQLRTYLERGGMLFADAICSSREFNEAFAREMAEIFPGKQAGAHPAERSAVHAEVWRRRPVQRRTARAATGGRRCSAPIAGARRRALSRRAQAGRPLRRHFFAVRHQLRAGKPRIAGVRRLHPQGRSANRPQRAVVFVSPVAGPVGASREAGGGRRGNGNRNPRRESRLVRVVEPRALALGAVGAIVPGTGRAGPHDAFQPRLAPEGSGCLPRSRLESLFRAHLRILERRHRRRRTDGNASATLSAVALGHVLFAIHARRSGHRAVAGAAGRRHGVARVEIGACLAFAAGGQPAGRRAGDGGSHSRQPIRTGHDRDSGRAAHGRGAVVPHAAGRDDHWGWSALAGAALGLCVLCRPAFLVWLLAVVVLFPWAAAGSRRFARPPRLSRERPWCSRPGRFATRLVFGRPLITTTHGGYTLLLANNPEFYDYLRNAPWGGVWDARSSTSDWRTDEQSHNQSASRNAAERELDADRRAYAAAWQNIGREPAMFAYSCLARLGRLWNVMPHQTSPDESPSRRGLRFAIAIWYLLELLLAAAGIALLRRQLLLSPWLWGTILVVSLSAVHTIFWTDMRMRAPLAIVVALVAAQAVAMLASGRAASSVTKLTT